MAIKIGWNPMPLSLKVFFFLIAVGTVFQLLALSSLGNVGIYLFGFKLMGTAAIITTTTFIILNVILLYSTWERLVWGWEYGVVLQGISILTILAAVPRVPEMVQRSLVQNPILFQSCALGEVSELVLTVVVLSFLFAVLLNAALMLILSHERSYFKVKKDLFGKKFK